MTPSQMPWWLKPAYWFSRRPQSARELWAKTGAMAGLALAVTLIGALVSAFDPGFASAGDAALVGAVLFAVVFVSGFFAMAWLWSRQTPGPPEEPPEAPGQS